ncbi:MAG: phosphatase PAP2 family protein [Bacteroidia bacterium]|jgi:membrane-associated phospholipid phosphatase|nr:phosphatase PAP2 family protein [Bacteroidia bacterium]
MGNQVWAVIIKNKGFYISYLVFLVVASVIQVVYTQEYISRVVNKFHSPIIDTIAKYGTHIGDGWFALPILLLLLSLHKNIKTLIIHTCVLYIPALITQLLKHTWFKEAKRPMAKLANQELIHLVEGVEIHINNSFPSGHSTSAFALFLLLSYQTKQASLQTLCLIFAVAVALTRVYLMQHFFEDIFAGSMIAVTCGTLITALTNKPHASQT